MSRNSDPHPLCIGKCVEFQARKPTYGKRYELGQKRCQMCDQWVLYDGARCPCCNYRLRTSPKSRTSEKNVSRI